MVAFVSRKKCNDTEIVWLPECMVA